MKKNIITSFEELDCWKACRNVRQYIMEIINRFPVEEKYALADGMRRASRSTTENIAEGFGRHHKKDRIKFYYNARGSVFETQDWLKKAEDRKLITDEAYKNIIRELNQLPKEINQLIKFTFL